MYSFHKRCTVLLIHSTPGDTDAAAVEQEIKRLEVDARSIRSAKIDGASDFRIYSTIVMPIAKPIIATMTILKAMWSWNMYMWPLIVCKKVEMMPLQVSIGFFQGQNVTQWGLLCAGMTIAMLPLLIVFLCCQKFFVGGIQAGAVKG